MVNIIEKIEQAGLRGRGGAGFPTATKWQAVKKQELQGKKIYIIANGSEGEPGVFKDEYILKKYPTEFIEGIKIALVEFADSEAVIYLNHTYYDWYAKRLASISKGFPINYFRKTARYIAGDETALISHIEGKRDEPRIKPPYPAESGLHGMPTLVNNIETYYRVFQIAKDQYQNKTFYSISGSGIKKQVYDFPVDYTIKEVLVKSGNWPKDDFFIQYGGGAAGSIYLPEELDNVLPGAASIIIFNTDKTNPYKLMRYWAEFYAKENCDKCTPCREGSMRILEMLKEDRFDRERVKELFLAMEQSSFCPLGRGMSAPYKSLIEKVIR
jgi:NADH:ubiquinone oxidoreductase subunit F (NADH-binding)